MTKPAFSKILFVLFAALIFACVPKPASARRGESSHGGGSSHGSSRGGGSSHGRPHGGASFHGGGHPTLGGGRRSYGSPRGGSQMGRGSYNGARMNGRSYSRPGNSYSHSSANFTRNSAFGHGGFSSSAAPRNFSRSGDFRAASRGFRSAAGGWHGFGNSTGRSMSASARTSGNLAGGGWHSFGNSRLGAGAEISRAYASNARADGQWYSFGNPRNASFGVNASAFRSSRAEAWNTHAPGPGFDWNRFSTNMPESARFSPFSSGHLTTNFKRSRFGGSEFGGSDFGDSIFGRSSFSNSLIGSGASLIPGLLLGGLFSLGTSVFGGRGILGGNALSFAARSFGSGLLSSGFSQGGFAGSESGLGQGGFSWDFGFAEAPIWPPCGAGASFWRSGWAWSSYCEPNPYYPLGWTGIGYLASPRIDSGSANSDVN